MKNRLFFFPLQQTFLIFYVNKYLCSSTHTSLHTHWRKSITVSSCLYHLLSLLVITFADTVCLWKRKGNVWQSPDMALGPSKTHGCSLFSRLISSPEETTTGCTDEVELLQLPTLLLARCQQLSWFFCWISLWSTVWLGRSTRGDTTC